MSSVLVLVPAGAERSPPPEALPLGGAALRLAAEGVDVVFGTPSRHRRPVPGAWREVAADIGAVYDRFPSLQGAAAYDEAVAQLAGRPLGNPQATVRLCQDKVACQRALEAVGVPCPPLCEVSQEFPLVLAEWGVGFLKPRFGALGRGVHRVRPGDALPAYGLGVRGVVEPLLLQRAVPIPAPWAGMAVRVLVQRTEAGELVALPGVARASLEDPVAGFDRGSEVSPAEDLLGVRAARACEEVAGQAAIALGADPRVVELGVDVVWDGAQAWVIEVNGRPRGRLRELARRWPERFGAVATAALERPLRLVAGWREFV